MLKRRSGTKEDVAKSAVERLGAWLLDRVDDVGTDLFVALQL